MFDILVVFKIADFNGYNHFEDNLMKDYLPVDPMIKTFCITGTNYYVNLTTFEYNQSNFHSRKGDANIFISGEVFSTVEFSKSIGEKPRRIMPDEVLELYFKHGNDFIKKLKGIFFILIIDNNKDECKVFNCRSGLLDLFYYVGSKEIIFATSILSLNRTMSEKLELDYVSIMQYVVFDYPLSDRTLFKNIHLLNNGEYICLGKEGFSKAHYFNYLELFNNDTLFSWDETYKLSPDIFNSSIGLHFEDKLCSGLTSGFDSRTNLSWLINTASNVLYYSWGMHGSVDVKIPQIIARETDIKYRHIPLNETFENEFDFYAKQAVIWSNGQGTILRANHTYGFNILKNHSRKVITGLFGSELLRPANAVGHVYNQVFIDVLVSKNQKEKLVDVFEKEKSKMLMNSGFYQSVKDAFVEDSLDYFKSLNSIGDIGKQLHFFSLKEGFRKYFGHEINSSRQHVRICSPYIDDDFVKFILQTPVPKLNKFAFKRNPKSLRFGQLFYLPIIRKNYMQLLDIPTGRLYSPRHLESKFYPFSILPFYLKKRLFKSKANDTFNSEKWVKQFALQNKPLLNENYIFADIRNSMDTVNYSSLAKTMTLRFWFKSLFEQVD